MDRRAYGRHAHEQRCIWTVGRVGSGWRHLEQACKKAAFLIQSGGLGHIVIDLGLIVIDLASNSRKVAT